MKVRVAQKDRINALHSAVERLSEPFYDALRVLEVDSVLDAVASILLQLKHVTAKLPARRVRAWKSAPASLGEILEALSEVGLVKSQVAGMVDDLLAYDAYVHYGDMPEDKLEEADELRGQVYDSLCDLAKKLGDSNES